MKNELTYVGKQVTALRKKREMSSADLAEKVGCSRTTIWNIESGDRDVWISTLSRVADCLEVDLATLFIDAAPDLIDQNHALKKIADKLQQDNTELTEINQALTREIEGIKIQLTYVLDHLKNLGGMEDGSKSNA